MLSTLQSANGGQPESYFCSGSVQGAINHFLGSLAGMESTRAIQGFWCSPVDAMVNATRLSNFDGEPPGLRSQPTWPEGLGSYGVRESESWSAQLTASRRALARGDVMAPRVGLEPTT